jgi:hypothetical protein
MDTGPLRQSQWEDDMSARTGIHEPGLTIKHAGPIGAGLIAAIAVAAGLGLALATRPASSEGTSTAPTADLVEFRAGERLPLVPPMADLVEFRAGERLPLVPPAP